MAALRLACSSWFVPQEPFSEKLACVERWGYEGLEIRLEENESLPVQVGTIEAALAGSSVKACSVVMRSPMHGMPLDSDDALNAKLANAYKALDIGARLGAIVVLVAEYRAQVPVPGFQPPTPLNPQENELLLKFLYGVAEYAERNSVTASIEPLNRYESRYLNRIEQAMALCDRINSQRLKICADFFHMNIEERDIAASIEAAAGRIGHVQLADSNRRLPGQGHLEFRPGFAALKQIGFDGFMALEGLIPSDPERELPECAAYLRRCMAE